VPCAPTLSGGAQLSEDNVAPPPSTFSLWVREMFPRKNKIFEELERVHEDVVGGSARGKIVGQVLARDSMFGRNGSR
jgi:hypothetical protein